MFHLFTLQGKRIDASLEHLPKTTRVHHTKSNNPVRKFVEGESSPYNASDEIRNSYADEAYKEADLRGKGNMPVFNASGIMSSPVITIEPETSAYNAWMKFNEKKVHHMLVVADNGKITGIVSDRDFLKKFIISSKKMETSGDFLVKDIMSSDVIAANILTDIRRIAKAMLDHHIGAMPIIDDNEFPVGIITRTDILYAIVHHPEIKFWA